MTQDTRNEARPTVKALDLSNLLKHAFSAGFQIAGGVPSGVADWWPDYDPELCPAYARILSALEAAPEPTPVQPEPLEATANVRIPDGMSATVAAAIMREHAATLQAKLDAYPEGPTAPEPQQEAVAFIDATGKVHIIDGSPLPDILRNLPDPPVGKKLIPLYTRPQPVASPVTDAAIRQHADAIDKAFRDHDIHELVETKDQLIREMCRHWRELRAALTAASPSQDQPE